MLLLQEISKKKRKRKEIFKPVSKHASITHWSRDSLFFIASLTKKKNIEHFMCAKTEKKLRKLRHFTHEKGADAYEP